MFLAQSGHVQELPLITHPLLRSINASFVGLTYNSLFIPQISQ